MEPANIIAAIPAPPGRELVLGPFTLHAYGLILGISIIAALMVVDRLLTMQKIDTERLYPAMVPAIIAGFIGARLYHVASEPKKFLESPVDIVKIWEGGLGIYGAVFGGAAVGLYMAHRNKIPLRRLADAAAPGMLIAQVIGRWGNYVNQELFGGPTSLPWGLEVDPRFRPQEYVAETTFHPTFLYESLLNLLLFVVFIVLHQRWKSRAPGALFPLYIGAYSIVRIFVEHLRIDEAHVWFGLRQNEWIAGAIAIASFTVVALMQRRHRRHQHSSSEHGRSK